MSLRLRIALSALFVIALAFVSRHHHLDDALIYFRYMRNALHGFGLVYNPGQHINALTAPFYTFLLLLTSWLLHGNIFAAAALLFVGPMIAACALAERLFAWSGMLLASMAYFYTTAGMETALLVFLIMLALTLITEGRLAWLPAVLILLALTRFEAGALIPVCLVFFYKKKTWPPVISYVPALAIVAAYLITNHHFFGAFLPQSANAKLGQGRSEYWGSWPMGFLLINPLLNTFNGVRLVLPLLIAGALIGAFRMRSSNWNALTLPFAAIMLAFYVLFNIPDYTWYYAPFILLLVLFAAAALPSTRLTMVCVLCVVVVQFVAAEHVLSAPEERYENYKQLAYWINSNALPGATVEACEIGEIGWDSTHPIIDILGLNMPKNAVHIAHKDAASWLKEDRPDYVVMHRKTWVWEKVAFNSPEYEVAPFSAGDVYLLRRKGVIDKSNDHP